MTESGGQNICPAYSADGKEIAFCSGRTGRSKIAFISARTGIAQVWVMNADGSNPVQLTFDAAPKGQLPDWSPDDAKIAYQSTATGNGDIYVMNADGSDPTRLTDTTAQEFGTAWSPDGDQIAFVRVLGPTPVDRAIYVMDADGSGEHFVHQGSRVPAWQPLGARLH